MFCFLFQPEVGADDGTLASRNTKAKEQDYSEDEGEKESREQSEDEELDSNEMSEVRVKRFFIFSSFFLSSFSHTIASVILIFSKNKVPSCEHMGSTVYALIHIWQAPSG